MIANATVPGLTDQPASLSSSVINDLLREEYGFEGLVMTDSLSAGAISEAGYDVPAATVAAIAAGADLVLYGSTATPALAAQLSPENVEASLGAIQQAVVAATENGDLPIGRLNDAVDNILTARKINLC
jgi:beta-N-acetylhexosaminidase